MEQTASGLCTLITQLQSVFKTLRVLAFVGAAFMLAKYGWEAISSGKIAGKDLAEGTKNVGISMLVGFFLLFGIGFFISALLSGHVIDCSKDLIDGWGAATTK